MNTSRGNCILSLIAILFFTPLASAAGENEFASDPELVDRGRYLIRVAGCNDCHTKAYAMKDGNVPESEWLKGDDFGWRGPWGTTYGSNLRLYVSEMSEQQWVDAARTLRRRPPMPWFNLVAMEDRDLRSIYHFIRSLGDPGMPAPTPLAPAIEPSTSHAMWLEGKRSVPLQTGVE